MNVHLDHNLTNTSLIMCFDQPDQSHSLTDTGAMLPSILGMLATPLYGNATLLAGVATGATYET